MRARTQNGLLAALAALLLALAAGFAPAASGSTLAYQCGAGVCAVDPDVAGAQPRQLTADGRFAGITRDGATVAWVDAAGALVSAPAAGGAPTLVWNGGYVGNQPAISPDGQRFLWWTIAPDGLGGMNATSIRRLTRGAASSDGVSFCIYCVTSHGWSGDTAIAAFPSDGPAPSKVCRVATTAEAPEVRGSCVQQLVSDARGGIGFPSGSPDGREIVAALEPGATTGTRGRIVRYSVATGQPIGDVTDGTQDTTPTWSADGTQVAFDRAGQIVVRDLASGAERVVAAGVYPSWGGARTVPQPPPGGSDPTPPPGGRRPAPRRAPLLSLTGQRTPRALAAGGLRLRVRCERACRVGARLTVAAKDARTLGLRRGAPLASASGTRKAAGTVTLRPRVAAKVARRLRPLGALRVKAAVTIRPAKGASGRTTRTSATVRLAR